MSALYGLARAGSLAYVNNDQDDSVAPNRARPTRVMSGLRYAAEVAARLSPAGHGPTTPALYTQEGHPAPPLVNASASWLRHHASGSSGATPPTSAAVRQSPSHVARCAVAVATPRGHNGGAGFSSSVVAGGHSLPPLEATASADAAFGVTGSFQGALASLAAPAAAPPSHARRGLDDDSDDDEWDQEGDEESTPYAAPGTTMPRQMAASSRPTNKKRRGAATPGCSPPRQPSTHGGGPPGDGGAGAGASQAIAGRGGLGGGSRGARARGRASPTGRAGASSGIAAPLPDGGGALPRSRASPAAANGGSLSVRAGATLPTGRAGNTSSAAPATAAHVADMIRSTTCGFAGVRREITTQRKEVAILNSQLRAVTKNVDDIAVLVDRLTASLVFQRRTLVTISGDVSTVLTSVTADRAATAAPGTSAALDGAAATLAGGVAARSALATEQHDSRWVLDLKVCIHSGACAADMSMSARVSEIVHLALC